MPILRPDAKGLLGGRAVPPLGGFILTFYGEAMLTMGTKENRGSLSSWAVDYPIQFHFCLFLSESAMQGHGYHQEPGALSAAISSDTSLVMASASVSPATKKGMMVRAVDLAGLL